MQQNDEDPVTIRGNLEFSGGLEGGVWTLLTDEAIYDLHGNREELQNFSTGEKIEVHGRIRRDLACIHMRGIIFEVESIRSGE